MTADELLRLAAEAMCAEGETPTKWDYDDARAVLAAVLPAVAEHLRVMDPVEAALAGQHAWSDAADAVLDLLPEHTSRPACPDVLQPGRSRLVQSMRPARGVPSGPQGPRGVVVTGERESSVAVTPEDAALVCDLLHRQRVDPDLWTRAERRAVSRLHAFGAGAPPSNDREGVVVTALTLAEATVLQWRIVAALDFLDGKALSWRRESQQAHRRLADLALDGLRQHRECGDPLDDCDDFDRYIAILHEIAALHGVNAS